MLDQIWTMLQDQFANNDLFAGGAILMVSGAIFALVRRWPVVWWGWIKKQSMVVIDIPDKDPAFEWIIGWLAQDSYSQNRARLLTVKTKRDPKDRNDPRPKIIFTPAPGTHYLWYKRRFMILTRERQDPTRGGGSSGDDGNRDPFREYFTIRLLGRDRKIALDLLKAARDIMIPKTERRMQVMQVDYGTWEKTIDRPLRSLSTIILPEGQAEDLIHDIEQFLVSKEWYMQRGIPYRRSYMFYGPPGNGKSSTIVGLASEMNFDIGIINLRNSNLNDRELSNALTDAPPHTIILIEDIDCITDGRKMASEVTFSGLLNALDGVASPEGQIIIMTTNHLDQLDAALIRPGRCDRKIEFKNADTSQKTRMFERFYPGANLALDFVEACPDEISMAQLQGHFLKHRDCPERAISEAASAKEGA